MNNGDIIRSYRKRKKFTIKELAQKVGVSEQAISQYERSLRNPHYVMLHKICSVLDLPMELLSVEHPIIPSAEQIKKEPHLALDTQIIAYVDDVDRAKVKMMCEVLERYNYEVEIDKDIALVIDKISDEIFAKIPKNDFINMSVTFFSLTQGIIDNMGYRYKPKK